MKNIHILLTDKPSRLTKPGGSSSIKLYTNGLTNTPKGHCKNYHLYITSDEKIKEGGWHFNLALNLVEKTTSFHNGLLCEKIILTTDQDLIKNGVQAIDDKFLRWFVKNPSCERVEVGYGWIRLTETNNEGYWVSIPDNQFEMQQEESKQENCCTPVGQIKRYVDCVGCDRKPKQETLEETTEINLTRLCYYDKRNPDFQIKEEYGYDKEEVEATGNFSKKDCACDNCFYGRSKLTEQLIWQQERMYSEEDLRNAYRWGTTVNHGTKEHFNEWFEQFKKK
jgi:hypothetical protein